MDEEEGYSQEFLVEQRQRLQQMFESLSGRSLAALKTIMNQEHEVGDSVDVTTEEQGTSTMLRLKDRDVEQLRAIERALQQLDAGEYGECAECGEFINPRRLKARPMARLCIECQEEREEVARRNATRPGLIDEYM